MDECLLSGILSYVELPSNGPETDVVLRFLTFTVALNLVESCIDNDAVMLTCLCLCWCMRRCGALFGYRTCTMSYHLFVAKEKKH